MRSQAAAGRPLAGPRDDIHPGVITRHGVGQVSDHDGSPAVNHGEQPIAELAHVGHVDVRRKPDDRPAARPRYRELVIWHAAAFYQVSLDVKPSM
jgi:hypothetical protein